MTVNGHDFILQCRACYNDRTKVVRLESGTQFHTCPDCRASYKVGNDGFLERVK
ncbi:MAG TPA: hypothetical protein VGQ00_01100 [Candidatus Norongarragalinales archaeon]|nr:hypothetical protein [Candidatus Norongarragalinales archaeon]